MKRLVIVTVVFAAIAGVAYISTVGCCHFIWSRGKTIPLSQQLHLTAAQRQTIVSLEGNFMVQKAAACQTLCGKRAQLIQLLKQPEPDQATISRIVEEIGQEQTALEKATIDHLLAVRQHLEPSQRSTLADLVTEELRTACKETACGMTPGCAVTRRNQ